MESRICCVLCFLTAFASLRIVSGILFREMKPYLHLEKQDPIKKLGNNNGDWKDEKRQYGNTQWILNRNTGKLNYPSPPLYQMFKNPLQQHRPPPPPSLSSYSSSLRLKNPFASLMQMKSPYRHLNRNPVPPPPPPVIVRCCVRYKSGGLEPEVLKMVIGPPMNQKTNWRSQWYENENSIYQLPFPAPQYINTNQPQNGEKLKNYVRNTPTIKTITDFGIIPRGKGAAEPDANAGTDTATTATSKKASLADEKQNNKVKSDDTKRSGERMLTKEEKKTENPLDQVPEPWRSWILEGKLNSTNEIARKEKTKKS